jgi:heterodisulfide reductase subunit A-like polyferredoxin
LIDVLGEKVEEVKACGFRPSQAATALFRRWLPSVLYGFVSNQLVLTPEIRRARCTACLDCVRICPVRAISLVRDKAWVDEAGCIHCLCCHEACSTMSIQLKQRPLGRLFRGSSRLIESLRILR